MRLLLSLLILSVPAWAEEPPPAAAPAPSFFEKSVDAVENAADKVSQSLSDTKARRRTEDYFVLGNYSPFDLLIPSKIGASFGVIRLGGNKTWELEYLNGSVAVPFLVKDLGKMSDTRISLIGRNYFGGNSFNLSYGFSYFDFSLHLGDSLLSGLSGGAYPSIDLIQIQSLGYNVAVGNRWSLDHNIAIGVDWISWAQPVFTMSKKSEFLDHATNAEDRDKVDTAMKIITYFPRFAAFKVQLGILF